METSADYGEVELQSMLQEITSSNEGAVGYTESWDGTQDFTLDDFNTELNFGEGIDLEKLCQEVLNTDVPPQDETGENSFTSSPNSSSFSDTESVEIPTATQTVTLPIFRYGTNPGEQYILANGVKTRILKVSRKSTMPIILGRSGVMGTPTKIRIVKRSSLTGAKLTSTVQGNFVVTSEPIPPRVARKQATPSPPVFDLFDESTADVCSPTSSCDQTEDMYTGEDFQPLVLTDEEKKIMIQEKITLPDHYPLTREEERNLRRIRRKIRNKRSAQNSRKKKQLYVEDLEKRVKMCMMEKATLQKRVTKLETENASLLSQLRNVHTTMAGLAGKAAPTSTAFLILVMSVAMLMAPNMNLSSKLDFENGLETRDGSADQGVNVPSAPASPQKRMLLSDTRNLEDSSNLDKFWQNFHAMKRGFSSVSDIAIEDDLKPKKLQKIDDDDPGDGFKHEEFMSIMNDLMETKDSGEKPSAEVPSATPASSTVYLKTNGTRAI